MRTEEGKIKVDGFDVWYRRIGSGGTPLLTLHGGPGAGHDQFLCAVRFDKAVDSVGNAGAKPRAPSVARGPLQIGRPVGVHFVRLLFDELPERQIQQSDLERVVAALVD